MKNSSYEKWVKNLREIRENYFFGPIEIKKNELGEIHCDSGPAYISPTRIKYYKNNKQHGPDVDIFGSLCYYYENILVPSKYFNNPDSLTIEEVLANKNTEVRYVGIKLFGFDKLMEASEIVNENNGMILFKVNGVFTDPLLILSVLNSTPEPDGTKKQYYLTVPPTMKDCKEAVAWTFRKEPKDYHPSKET